jgi:DNA-directed RNA polymerase subunit beta'
MEPSTSIYLTEEEYLDILDSLPKENQYLDDKDPNKFIAKMGGDALWDLLSRTKLDDFLTTSATRQPTKPHNSVKRKR